MTTQTRPAGKRRHKIGALNLILALTLGTLIFFICKEINADAKSLGRAQNSGVTAVDAYTVLDMDSTDMAQGSLALVNNEHPYHFPDDVKHVSIYDHKNDDYFVRDKNVLLNKDIMDPLNDMMEGFADKTGLRDVNVVAGHRTYELQQKLYDDSIVSKGAEYTAHYVALPGCSEHHTGLAVDFSIFHSDTGDSADFNGSDGYGWFEENAWAYGFIRRFEEEKSKITHVADEPWHFRYVGVAHAYYMKQNDLCLEEYIDLLREYPCDGNHLTIDTGEQQYQVWFCPGLQAHVPEDGDYTISGNNVDGFIITADIG